MMPIPDELMDKPFMATRCSIEGFENVEEISDKVRDFMRSKFEVDMSKVKVKIVKRDESTGDLIIRIPSVQEELEKLKKAIEAPAPKKVEEVKPSEEKVESKEDDDDEDKKQMEMLLKQLELLKAKSSKKAK